MSISLTKIHFIRHAQSEYNFYKKMSGGGSDVALTNLGFEQANNRGQALTNLDNISFIVRSDMIRTKQTAETINSWLNLDIKIDKNLNEKYYGNLEGEDISTYANLMNNAKNFEDVVAQYGGESIHELRERVQSTMCKYFKSGEEEIIIVGHGHFGRIAYDIFYEEILYFNNADHVIFNPNEFDFNGKCNFIEVEL